MTSSRIRSANRFSISALALAGALAAAAPAFTHAALRHASPAAGAIIDASPAVLSIEFSEDIDLTAVELSLSDATGADVPLDKVSNEAKAGTKVVRTFAHALTPGAYEVKWRVVSTDGHHTRGTYTFEVKTGEQR